MLKPFFDFLHCKKDLIEIRTHCYRIDISIVAELIPTKGTRSSADDSAPFSSTTTTRRLVEWKTALRKKKCIINCDTTVQSGQAAPSNSKDFQGTWVVVKKLFTEFFLLDCSVSGKNPSYG